MLNGLNKMVFKKVTHVIFDLDGLLLDTEPIYQKVIHEIAKKFQKEYTEDVRMKVMGTTEKNTIRIAIEEMNLPLTFDQFKDEFSLNCRSYFSTSKLMPGAEHLLRHLSKHKVPIAIATSSGDESVRIKTGHHGDLFQLFNHFVMGSSDPEIQNGKPHPDIFLVAASRFHDSPKPEQCLVFEDSVNGVEAATQAQMQCVMVPDPNLPKENCKKATLILNSLEEFQPELFGLPPFES